MMGTPRGIDDLSDDELLRLWPHPKSQQTEGADPPLILSESVLCREFPSARGLLREVPQTPDQGQIDPRKTTWAVAQNLKRGDKLHDGKLDDIWTNDQHWELILACKISHAIRHDHLMSVLRNISTSYSEYQEFYSEFERKEGTLRQHQARLRDIAKHIKRLRPLLAAEPLMYQLLSDPYVKGDPMDLLVRRWEHAEWRAEDLSNDLNRIQQAAARLAKDDAELKKSRLSRAESRKSPERRIIWEPFFKFLTRWGHELRYSPDGPIMRALRIIHAGLEIEPPVGKSVQMAINEFKGKQRPLKKRRTRSSTLKRDG